MKAPAIRRRAWRKVLQPQDAADERHPEHHAHAEDDGGYHAGLEHVAERVVPLSLIHIWNLLKDKAAYPVREFYRLVDGALARPAPPGSARNAAQHVWGYMSGAASARERASFARLMERYEGGQADLGACLLYTSRCV